MPEHELAVVKLFNRIFGPYMAKLLSLLGVHVAPGEKVIPDYVVMVVVVVVILIAFAAYLRPKLSVENPGKLQHVMEVLVEGLRGLMENIIGHHHEWKVYLPFLATLGLFIFVSNMIGLISFAFVSPTSNINVTAALALLAFFYYQAQGIRKQGLVKHMKHFMGPIPALAPLMFIIEIISHLSRVLSLSVRLFANIFSEDLIIIAFAILFPLFLPLPIMFLAVFTSVLQAFLFVLLTTIYLAGVLAEEH